ncbi:MAG: Flagellar hook-associated protein 1 [Firmicutes bacterium]|nr:Flagellar hook-associated protein 1 [Bacillota bacterium]
MPSTFFAFNIARRGISAHKAALDVTSHNIANASTPGFSRQQAVFSTTSPFPIAAINRPAQAGQIGTGVTISEIRRMRDSFLDYQIRPQLSKLGEWDERYAALSHVEKILMEPTESGLSRVFSRFWNAWQELSKHPTSGATRAGVVETSVTLANLLNVVAEQTEVSLSDLNTKVRMSVNDVNSIAGQIAALNRQIITHVAAGLSPNDLADRRDALLDDLARTIGFTQLTQTNGSIDVVIGGRHLVQGTLASELAVDAGGQVIWHGSTTASITQGQLAGLSEAKRWLRDEFYARVNTLSVNLRDLVNTAHAAGQSLTTPPSPLGADFFVIPPGSVGREARFIRVNPDIVANHALVRARAIGAGHADGSNALAVSRQRHATSLPGGTNLEGYYNSLVIALGVETQQSSRMFINQDALVNQLHNRRQEAMGVSIDEEMAAMIQFQHGYAAAARLLTTLDETLEVIINLGR